MRLRLTALLLLLPQLADGHGIARDSSANTLSLKAVAHDLKPLIVLRGGSEIEDEDYDHAEGDDSDADNEDDIETENEDNEEGQKMDPKLTKSAMLSTIKVSAKKAAATKETVSSTLKVKKSTKKGSLIKALQLPYFVRACMNPFTVFAMTRAYFASLFNLNYLKEKDTSQGLRSAMEEKAKKHVGSNPRKGKRQMRPGQAKTLSDLPQLSA